MRTEHLQVVVMGTQEGPNWRKCKTKIGLAITSLYGNKIGTIGSAVGAMHLAFVMNGVGAHDYQLWRFGDANRRICKWQKWEATIGLPLLAQGAACLAFAETAYAPFTWPLHRFLFYLTGANLWPSGVAN